MAKFLELAKSIPEIGKECGMFIRNPRGVVVARKSNWSTPAGVYSVAGTMIALSLIFIALYGILFGPISDRLQSAILNSQQAVKKVASTTNIPPELVDWGITFGFGVGITFPEGFNKKASEPQFAIFRFGAAQFLYNHVVPEKITSGSIPLILQLLFALLIAICIHPFAIIFKGSENFQNSLKYAILLFSYTITPVMLIAVATAFVFVEVIKLKGMIIFLPWTVFVLLPMAIIGVRGYFAGYAELYLITKKKILLSAIPDHSRNALK